MFKLYALQGACSLASHISLIWAELPFEIEILSRKKLQSPEFIAKNPQGAVPVLEGENGLRLTQNAGVLTYIARESLGADIGPKGDSLDEAEFMSLLGYLNSDFHPCFGPIFSAKLFGISEAGMDDFKATAEKRINQHLAYLNGLLEGKKYLYDERKTVVDAYLWVMLGWIVNALKGTIENYANVKVFYDHLLEDKGVQQALKTEGLA